MPTILNNDEHKALTTLARLKAVMGIGSDSNDSALIMMINQATGFIEQYTKRRLNSQTYTNEEYDGTGNASLVLKQFPVTDLSSFQYNQAEDNSDDWQTYNTNDYWWYDDGRIHMRTGRLMERTQKYRATYTAGYLIDFDNENDPSLHTLPPELEYACQQLVSGLFNKRSSGGIQTSKIGDQSITYTSELMNSPEIKAILDKYAQITL